MNLPISSRLKVRLLCAESGSSSAVETRGKRMRFSMRIVYTRLETFRRKRRLRSSDSEVHVLAGCLPAIGVRRASNRALYRPGPPRMAGPWGGRDDRRPSADFLDLDRLQRAPVLYNVDAHACQLRRQFDPIRLHHRADFFRRRDFAGGHPRAAARACAAGCRLWMGCDSRSLVRRGADPRRAASGDQLGLVADGGPEDFSARMKIIGRTILLSMAAAMFIALAGAWARSIQPDFRNEREASRIVRRKLEPQLVRTPSF